MLIKLNLCSYECSNKLLVYEIWFQTCLSIMQVLVGLRSRCSIIVPLKFLKKTNLENEL